MFGLGWDHRVPECPETVGSVELGKVHQIGKPINHSTKRGFSRRPEFLGDIRPVALGAWRPRRAFVGTFSLGSVPSFQSLAVGVAQRRLAIVSGVPAPLLL